MQIRTFKTAVAATLLLSSIGAFCEPSGPYVGASLGTPDYPGTINGFSSNGSALSGKLYGGYQFTPNFALEAGVADLGRVGQRGSKVRGSSAFVDAVGIAPLTDQWALLGRIGVAHTQLKTPAGNSSSDGLKLGLGAQYMLTSNVALRGEWEQYRPNAFGGHRNIDQYTIGVRVGF